MGPIDQDLLHPSSGCSRRGELHLHNLLTTFGEQSQLLVGELRRGNWLDAFLLSAGMSQILEDHLHPDPYALRRGASYLDGLRSSYSHLAGRMLRSTASWIDHAQARRAETRQLIRDQRTVADFVEGMASLVFDSREAHTDGMRALTERGRALFGQPGRFPVDLQREVVNLPASFRGFDQRPADLERLVGSFAERQMDRRRPLMVVGVRTSGSYLAPLYAAALRRQGYEDVSAMTARPGRPFLNPERRMLRALCRRGGLVLLTDDPPKTGTSLAASASQLKSAGVPHASIVLMLCLISPGELPEPLRSYSSLLLPWSDWAIHAQLSVSAIRAELDRLFSPDARTEQVERLPVTPTAPTRGHVQALFRVQLAALETGRRTEKQVLVKGTGLGYLGRHAVAVAEALPGLVPDVYGFRDGLVYREWLPDEWRLPQDGRHLPKVADAVAEYTEARHQALRVDRDRSLEMPERAPVWEIASDVLSSGFGRLGPALRPLLLDRVVRFLLQVEEPSVIDGRNGLSRWFSDPSNPTKLWKVDPDEGAFSNREVFCYDAVFDLASTVAGEGDSSFGRRLRKAWEARSSTVVDDERWLLYELVHLWDLRRSGAMSAPAAARASARALQRYFASIYLDDVVGSPDSGGLCALDIDGVLETSSLGFAGTTPAGAQVLRALIRHGYRPVLATGRSVDEVIERCRAYKLSGGVAEYGAAVYDHRDGCVVELLSAAERRALDRVRAGLRQVSDVHLDTDYQRAVRAYRLDAAGRRHGLDRRTVAAVLQFVSPGQVRIIKGDAQTDFIAARIDKGVGIRALAARLGADRRATGTSGPLALAVGDGIADLPLLASAELALAPGNAAPAVRRAGIPVLRQSYQAGLAKACAELLGHRPGSCPCCQPPPFSTRTKLLLGVLGVQQSGSRGIPLRLVEVAGNLARAQHGL